ncbi:MAG: hypothetical protein ACP5FH_09640 [Terracidiphilus sp.]
MARVGIGGHGLTLNETAVRRVRIEAGNAEAAVGGAAGGRLEVETQSGGNQLHGQGFLFSRQNLWGAQNPFSQWVTETAPATLTSIPVFGNGPFGPPESYTPPDRETTWSVGAGSPILRNKLFWFAAVGNSERDNPGLSMAKHPYLVKPTSGCVTSPCPPQVTGFFAQPSNDELQVLSARLGLSSNNPVAAALLPYSGMLETLDGLLGPAQRTATQWTGFGRIDWKASARQSFTLEGSGAYWNSPGGGLTRVSENYGNHSYGSTRATDQWLLGRWQTFLTPNLMSVTQVAAGHTEQQARPSAPSAFEQTLLQGSAWGQLPQIVVDSRYGFTIGNPSRFGRGVYPDEHVYQEQEQLDWVHGRLLVKAGFQASHNTDATSLLRNQTGTYHYASVENFISDALVFQKFGLSGELNPDDQHNCDQTGTVWTDSGGNLRGLGALPCYSYYSQTMGPADWRLSTNEWAGYASALWTTGKGIAVSAGLRWEREQLPPPIAAVDNPQLPPTERLPRLGNEWAPRLSLAAGSGQGRWPMLQLGYGMYYGRTSNLAVETVLTQTGSLQGDLNFFLRPTDDLPNYGGGAPPFPYVLSGEPGTVVKPGAVQFAPRFRNPEVHQAVAAIEKFLPGHVVVNASAVLSLGRRLPISIDTNLDAPTAAETITYNVVDPTGAGPIKATQITVPFYASWPSSQGSCPYYQPQSAGIAEPGRPCPDYQQITQVESRANSTYEAGVLRIAHYGRRGLSLIARYTYAHAMDWNPNGGGQMAGNDVLDPSNFGLEYGTSNLDVRHSAVFMTIYNTPWKLTGMAGKLGNGWMISAVGMVHSGLPYTMRTSGWLPEEFASGGMTLVGLGPGMNGSGGDNRVYGQGNDGRFYNIGRNTYRYPPVWKADLRLGKRFYLGEARELELLAESFNLFNHQNVTELETNGYFIKSGNALTPPTLNFMSGPVIATASNGTIEKASSTAFGQPLDINATNFYRERQFEFGLRMSF